MKAGKVWGNTELIEHNNTFEFHRIEFMANHCLKNRFGPNHGTSEFSIHYPTLTISDGDIHDIGSTSADVISVMDGLGK